MIRGIVAAWIDLQKEETSHYVTLIHFLLHNDMV